MTIKEIAESCGVSRGTVDRVLNHRGRVKPETERLILDAMARAGYSKNMAGRALTVRRGNPVIGAVLCGQGNPFFDDVLAGMARAEAELKDWGVTLSVKNLSGYRLEDELDAIREMSRDTGALILHPISDDAVRRAVDELRERGVPCVTLNTDLVESARVAYVGSDYYHGGLTAGGMMTLCMGGSAQVGVAAGSRAIEDHSQRLRGFLDGLGKDMRVMDIFYGEDNLEAIYRGVSAQLRKYPDMDAVFVAAAGAHGACQAVIDAGREGRVSVFGFDRVPAHVEMMRRGIIKALICQQPERQGYEAVRAAWDALLGEGAVVGEKLMDNQIRILQNVDDL